MNQKSSKQKEIDTEYAETLKILAKREYICTGCGATDALTPSHLVPRSRKRSLVAVARNVTWHCLTCHPIWESPKRMELNDYTENMVIVKELDEEYYNLLIVKQDEYYNT
jgi:5-methylcytosine-specific restriction endonuclease McrA